ncbi:hypothetical protein ORI20_25010 [Mycobacterium sp. CVI_P3]|uniref:Transposase n=1 Tax=Mycobacterium pinniadriaticum TaxID=2994102 RepID=A0ABT3SKA8_9MYCO|nr:hypothetical protein [Mycobacterium pinniadriaticum]MCX2933538.1 hypothetical protein [Mycobacterium pinniadriaticum]MCX2939961.1 hypothetical protein [Mycobacterium pinniadriaticum]
MTANGPVFKAFNEFGVEDIPAEAEISQRMLRRLEDIEAATSARPNSPAARAALASSVIAHAVIELEIELLQLKDHLHATYPDFARCLSCRPRRESTQTTTFF